MEKIFPTATVRAGGKILPLPSSSGAAFDVRFTHKGQTLTTDDFMKANDVAGLLIIRDGKILTEKYRLGLTRNGRWTSFSVAKSVTSALVGAAIKDGYIKSVSDPITRYIPKLSGSAYDGATIRDLLTMSSGARWNEDYTDPSSDAAKLKAFDHGSEFDVVDYMSHLPRETKPGAKFQYRTGDSHLLGIAVANATGRPLSTYLSEKIWKPFGMQSDAYWVTSKNVVLGGSYLSMSLRDFGRFGLFMLNGGKAAGKDVLPVDWTKEASSPLYPAGAPGVSYGYQWWVADDGSYRAVGIFGQSIRIDPARKLVIVILSAWPEAGGAERYKLIEEYVNAVKTALN
jgi:CubicO group peptidase (beta-lactamase class C family)